MQIKTKAGLLVLAVIVSGCFRLDSFLFNPSTDIEAYLFDDYEGETEIVLSDRYRVESEDIHLFSIPSDNGNLIWGTYVGDTSTIDQDTVIVYCHGRANHMDFYWPRVKLLSHIKAPQQYGVLTFDYQGYGRSEGTASEEALYADTRAMLQWLFAQGGSTDRVVMYGFSLGTAPATKVMLENFPADDGWLVLEAPFASADVFVQDATLLSTPGSFVVDLSIDVAEHVAQLTQPLMWLHGFDDAYIPLEGHGDLVFAQSASTYKHAALVKGAGHSDVPQVMQYEVYLYLLEQFLEGQL